MPGQVMPDIDVLDNALYVSLQNSGIVVTGPSFPYSGFAKDKTILYRRDIGVYTNNEYDTPPYSEISIDKVMYTYEIGTILVSGDNPFEYIDFEIEKGQLLKRKDTILSSYAFEIEEQEFEEIYSNIGDYGDYPDNYFDSIYYFFVDNPRPYLHDINEEDLTIIQEFIKLKPEVYSPPRELTDMIGLMESIDFDVLSYDYMSSPILYTGITPFIQIGTRINKVVYPKTVMQARGRLGRRFCS